MKTFLGAISHYCLNIRVLEFHLSQPFGTKDAALQAWNRTYQNEQTGTFYKSPVILDKPVIAFRSSYLSDPPENRQTKKFPTTCHTSVRLYLKSDEDLPITLDTIAFYSPHLQSLVIDRSKSLPGLGIEDKGEHERMARCLRPPQYVSIQVSSSSSPANYFKVNPRHISFVPYIYQYRRRLAHYGRHLTSIDPKSRT